MTSTAAPTAPPQLRTFREVCGQLRMSERKARLLLAHDEFPVPHVRVGRLIMFRPNEVDAFVLGQEVAQ